MGIAKRPRNTPANMIIHNKSCQYDNNCTYISALFKIGQNISLSYIRILVFFCHHCAFFSYIYTLWSPFVYERGSFTSKQSTTTRKQIANSSSSCSNRIIVFIVIIIWWHTSVVPRHIFILLKWCDYLNMEPTFFRARLVKIPKTNLGCPS